MNVVIILFVLFISTLPLDHCVKHTNTTPFKCETCGRAFTFLNNLRRHRKIHKDYRPHRCHQCGKRFIEPRCLRLHINRIHLGMDVKPQGYVVVTDLT